MDQSTVSSQGNKPTLVDDPVLHPKSFPVDEAVSPNPMQLQTQTKSEPQNNREGADSPISCVVYNKFQQGLDLGPHESYSNKPNHKKDLGKNDSVIEYHRIVEQFEMKRRYSFASKQCSHSSNCERITHSTCKRQERILTERWRIEEEVVSIRQT